jgi:glycosyltransferase involved in cell wall biosynthesis
MHKQSRFDAIISFDLMGAGGLAWRLGRELGIPASGWATGSDIRVSRSSAHGRAVIRALRNLDVVFYQNCELQEKAAELLQVSVKSLSAKKHVVLPRGILSPPRAVETDTRNRARASWGVKPNDVVVLYLGRIAKKKGMLELLEALALSIPRDPRIKCVLIGSKPAFDDTSLIKKRLRQMPELSARVMLLPECSPDHVWDILAGADVFAFPSHNEGMPNSLLEAMALGVPPIAFAIPAVRELEAGTGGVLLVPPLDSKLFAEAMLRLASSPDERTRIGEKARSVVENRFTAHKNMAKAVARIAELVQNRISDGFRARIGLASHSLAR